MYADKSADVNVGADLFANDASKDKTVVKIVEVDDSDSSDEVSKN
jgi:hypothetical protein